MSDVSREAIIQGVNERLAQISYWQNDLAAFKKRYGYKEELLISFDELSPPKVANKVEERYVRKCSRCSIMTTNSGLCRECHKKRSEKERTSDKINESLRTSGITDMQCCIECHAVKGRSHFTEKGRTCFKCKEEIKKNS